MDTTEPVQHLSDVVDLLSMLEYLTEGISREGTAVVPWAGITLTLRQSREIVMRVQERLGRSYGSEVRHEQPKGGTLADRVQQIPMGGSRARDLLAASTPGAKPVRPPINSGKALVNDLPES